MPHGTTKKSAAVEEKGRSYGSKFTAPSRQRLRRGSMTRTEHSGSGFESGRTRVVAEIRPLV